MSRIHRSAYLRAVLVVLAPVALVMTQVPAYAAPALPPVVDDSAVPDPMTAQVTDPVAPATFTATTSQAPSALTASAIGLPSGVTVSAPTQTSGGATWTISGTPLAAPGTYPVHVTVTDPAGSDSFDFDVEVEPEDSTVVYTGPTNVVGPDWEESDVPVTMTAQVTQAADGSLGDINTATVDFTDTIEAEDLCTDVPVITAGAGPGTATCTFDADVFDDDTVTYHVALTVGGSYRGISAAGTVLTVSLPPEPDPVLPNTVITDGPSGWLLATKGTFDYASTMPDDDTDFYCRLDGAKVACKGSSVTLTGLSQRTHRFTVVAENEYGDADETPAVREFAVPVDDAGLATSGAWKRKNNPASYLGTYTQAQKKGVSLSYKVADVRELALLVKTGTKYGAVKVYLDGALLKTVKTAGPAGSKSIRVGHFDSGKSGIVKIVTTTGKTVRIDGLGVSTAAF